MGSELNILILTSSLAALHFMPYLFAYVFVRGLPVAVGNRSVISTRIPGRGKWINDKRR